MAILPFYVEIIADKEIGILRFLRVLRLYKLICHLRVAKVLGVAIKNAWGALMVPLFMLLLLTITFATLIYYVERDVDGSDFINLPQSLWFTLVTLSTVGYGDLSPETPLGKAICM